MVVRQKKKKACKEQESSQGEEGYGADRAVPEPITVQHFDSVRGY